MRLSLCPILLVVLAGVARADDAKVDFNRDVRPILSGTCFKCHGVDDKARKAKLRLDTREGQQKEGVIVAGKPVESDLITRIFSNDEDERMPPPDSAHWPGNTPRSDAIRQSR